MRAKQRANLMKLGIGLMVNARQLKKNFDMGTFLDTHSEVSHDIKLNQPAYATSEETMHTCGTAACALGWAPLLLGITENQLLRYKNVVDIGYYPAGPFYQIRAIDYTVLGEKLFGVGADEDAWDWMFGGAWHNETGDNTPRGAAGRIGAYLAEPEFIEGLMDDGSWIDFHRGWGDEMPINRSTYNRIVRDGLKYLKEQHNA